MCKDFITNIYRFLKTKLLTISITTSYFLSLNSFGVQKLKIADVNGQVLFQENLNNWKYKTNFLGFDHVFLLPTKNDKHSNFSLTFTGKKIELFSKELTKNINDYKNGRKQWAKKRGVEIISFEKYNFSKNKFGVENHKTGFTYTTKFLGEVKEISIFTICKDKSLIHSKALLFKEHYLEEKSIRKFLGSIETCQNRLRK